MNVQIAAVVSDAELILHLPDCQSFDELKNKLVKQLDLFSVAATGVRVILDVGNFKISEKNLVEIKNIILNRGFSLQEINFSGSSSGREQLIDPNPSWAQEMSEYEHTALVCRNLRSGQKIYAQGNIVILGDVNPGAEIVAGGNILVMGVLRGMAHAGRFGDTKTLIAAYRLSPTQLRIANHITRPPDGDEIKINFPELARIRAGKVVIEKMRI